MALSKEEAEAASSELLATAHAGDAKRKRADINWNLLVPLFAAGAVAVAYGSFSGSSLPLAGGVALIVVAAFLAMRLFAETAAVIVAGAWLAIKSRGGEREELGRSLIARLPGLLLLVVLLVGALACLALYMRPAKSPQAPVADAPGCRLLGDWTVTYGNTLSLYTFNPDGTYVVHGDLYAPPTGMGDWALNGGKMQIWGGVNMRRAHGAYDETPLTWEDDAHFKMGGGEFTLLRKAKAGSCKN